MANIAHDMIRDALSIFVEFDEEKAKSIWTQIWKSINFTKITISFVNLWWKKIPLMASSVFEVLFISKSLERVCDHAVNISKEIFFMATSRDVRHAPEYKKAALRRDLK